MRNGVVIYILIRSIESRTGDIFNYPCCFGQLPTYFDMRKTMTKNSQDHPVKVCAPNQQNSYCVKFCILKYPTSTNEMPIPAPYINNTTIRNSVGTILKAKGPIGSVPFCHATKKLQSVRLLKTRLMAVLHPWIFFTMKIGL